jgi:hypothetical protein
MRRFCSAGRRPIGRFNLPVAPRASRLRAMLGRVTESAGTRLKLHRRNLSLDGFNYVVLSPRPSTTCRFATNFYHATWHVLTDVEGAQFLGRLCWGLAYQRRERTIVVIGSPWLVPNPFDADPSSPIVIVNNELGSLSRRAIADLRSRLPFDGRPAGTVTLQTPGLDAALGDEAGYVARERGADWRWNPHQQRRWIDGVRGLIVLAAPSPVLREWGFEASRLGRRWYRGSDAIELDHPTDEGEIQVLKDFSGELARAQAARESLFPGRAAERLTEEERALVWSTSADSDLAALKSSAELAE